MAGVKGMKRTAIMLDEDKGERICSKCHVKKPLSEYHWQGSRNITRSVCKECVRKSVSGSKQKYNVTIKVDGELYERWVRHQEIVRGYRRSRHAEISIMDINARTFERAIDMEMNGNARD